jgi:hypothetical protein
MWNKPEKLNKVTKNNVYAVFKPFHFKKPKILIDKLLIITTGFRKIILTGTHIPDNLGQVF